MRYLIIENAKPAVVANVALAASPFDPGPGFTAVAYEGPAEVGWGWDGTTATPLPPPLPPLDLYLCMILMDSLLAQLAKAWGYDSTASAVSYIGDPNPKYNAEGIVIRNYRSAMWTTGETLLAKLDPENPPTREQFIAMLPPAPSRPVV